MLMALCAVGGASAQEIEVVDDAGLVSVEWETRPGVAYRLQGSGDLGGWSNADGDGWLYGLGQRISYAVHSYDPGGGGGAPPLGEPPSSSHTFVVSEFAAQNKLLVSWGGDHAGQVLLARSALPVGLPPVLSVEVDDGGGGHYALSFMVMGMAWQPAYLSDPALVQANLSGGQSAELAQLTGAYTEIATAIANGAGSTQGSSAAPGGARHFYRLELDHPDSDGDGLPDWREFEENTSAFHRDTDRDGYGDGWEVANGLDPGSPTSPADAEDQLETLAPTAKLNLLIGDNSSSLSETYHLVLYELDPETDEERYECYRLAMTDGTDIARTDQAPLSPVPVRRDRAYHAVVEWQSSTRSTPDYDYVMDVWEEVDSGALPKLWVRDEGGMIYEYVGQADDHRDSAEVDEGDVKEGENADERPRVEIDPFLVTHVRFRGDGGASPVRFEMSDDAGQAYGVTAGGLWHWLWNRGGEPQDPVLYTMGTRISVSAKIRSAKAAPAGITVKGYATAVAGDITYEFGTADDLKTLATNGQIHTFPETQSLELLPSHVDFHDPFEIRWTVTPNDGAKWFDAGTTKNPMYVSLKDPAVGTPDRRHTTVHLACSEGHATTEEEAFANTWAQLGDGTAPANFTTWDGKPLHYYMNTQMGGCTQETANEMLSGAHGKTKTFGEGQCGAWQDLLYLAAQVNGVGGVEKVRVERSDLPGRDFLIKKWDFANPASHPGEEYPYVWPGDLTNLIGIAGQNEATPAEKKFLRHKIIRYGMAGASGPYFDPAYGTTYTGEADFEAKVVAGYFNDDRNRAKKPDAETGELIKFTTPPTP